VPTKQLKEWSIIGEDMDRSKVAPVALIFRQQTVSLGSNHVTFLSTTQVTELQTGEKKCDVHTVTEVNERSIAGYCLYTFTRSLQTQQTFTQYP